ncbi:hypothetical protein [Streptomyces pacificus]|uniref:ACT domain-containing protein n=1 Tax=Streptomyces pacificus TaxID=2705029 RepID=A0A6A0ATV6_9ACTN|nr:hypothetical protein [Streptomyces pacificus]GFH35761.1 hypothetical protein SCWH03_19830 [Streptomyces pacificus]
MDQSARLADPYEQARVTLMGVPRDGENLFRALKGIIGAGPAVEMVWAEETGDAARDSGRVDVHFLLPAADLHQALGSIRHPAGGAACSRIRVDRQVTRIDLRLPGRGARRSLLARLRSTGCDLERVSLVSRPDGNTVLLVPREGFEEVEHAAIVEQGRYARYGNSASDPEEWV